MSYCSMMLRDFQSLQSLSDKISVLPLGSGALAGNPFNIDRDFMAEKLGFKEVSLNSLDATGSRDFVGK